MTNGTWGLSISSEPRLWMVVISIEIPATELDLVGRDVLGKILDSSIEVDIVLESTYIFIPNTSASK